MSTNIALVTVLGGNPVEVVISTDPEALERRGKTFVEEQGSNAHYKLCEVEILPSSEQAADMVSNRVLEPLSAPQDMQVVPLWTCPECGGAEYICVVAPETADQRRCEV